VTKVRIAQNVLNLRHMISDWANHPPHAGVSPDDRRIWTSFQQFLYVFQMCRIQKAGNFARDLRSDKLFANRNTSENAGVSENREKRSDVVTILDVVSQVKV